jgi:hypothetical protein
MTIHEFCASTNLTDKQVYTLRDAGLITPDMPASQVELARLVKALSQKGVKLSAIARSATPDISRGGFVVYDGHELRTCRDAVTAITTVVKAKRPCRAVDLSAIRAGAAIDLV